MIYHDHTVRGATHSPRQLIAVGFGRHAQRTALAHALANPSGRIDIPIVTCLAGGQKEYETAVVPFFRLRSRPPPSYIPVLPQALEELAGAPSRAVLISTPNVLHFHQAELAIAAGFDVFVERPIATPADDLPSLITSVKEHGRVVFTAIQRRTEQPFRYIYGTVKRRRKFGFLTSIRCTLAVGERPAGWRADRSLAGGGVVLDSGYHLLDCASWLAEAAGYDGYAITSDYVSFSRSTVYPYDSGLESTAIGHLTSPEGLTILFDLSYDAPCGSVYERLEVCDEEGTRVALTRSQHHRSATPGTVTHQCSDGSIIDPYRNGRVITLPPVQGTGVQPFADFIRNSAGNQTSTISHPCSADRSLTTWSIIRKIYANAEWR